MFTGLIEEVGVIAHVTKAASGSFIEVFACLILQNLSLGDSVAVDGACMTLVALTQETFSFEVSPESLSKTNFGSFQPGRRVNLERPLTPESRIGGHYVTGHVDGLAKLVSMEEAGNSWVLWFEVDNPELAELFIPKGSVAVLGISLTINQVTSNGFSVAIIPHTMTHTNLSDYQIGDFVNIETDLLGKYVRRLLFKTVDASGTVVAPSASQSEPPGMIDSLFPFAGEISPGVRIDTPTLVPAIQSLGNLNPVATPADAVHPRSRTLPTPKGANIRTGSWFNHDPE